MAQAVGFALINDVDGVGKLIDIKECFSLPVHKDVTYTMLERGEAFSKVRLTLQSEGGKVITADAYTLTTTLGK